MLIAPPRHLAALAALGAALAVPPAHAQTVQFAGRTLQTNIGQGSGAVALDGTSLRMMDGEYEAARSALSTSQFNLFGAWSTTYTMRFSCVGVSDACPGDGIAFVATAGDATQVGEGGLLQGYQGGPPGTFGQSVAFGINPFWDWAVLGRDGELEFDFDNPVNVGHPWELDPLTVTLSYDGIGLLTAELSAPPAAMQSMSFLTLQYAWTAPAWAANARVGFTSASGAASEFSWVDDWSLNAPEVSSVPEPSTPVLLTLALLGLAVSGRARQRRA